jgi:hypothetical protein
VESSAEYCQSLTCCLLKIGFRKMNSIVRIILSATALFSLIVKSDGADKKSYDISSLERKFGSERIQENNAIKCTLCGFNSKASLSVLDNLLLKFDKKESENNANIYDNGEKFLVFDSEKLNYIKSDVSFVYTHHMSVYDEETTLLNMQKGLKSITTGEVKDNTKKMLVLIIDGPQAASGNLKSMLEEAWATLDKSDVPNTDIMAQIVVHIVSVNGTVSTFASDSVDSIVNDEILEGKPLVTFFTNVQPVKSESNQKGDPSNLGIDICKEAVSIAITFARDEANASLQKMQKLEAAGEFAGFIEKLIKGSITRMRETVKKSGGASEPSLKVAEAEISRLVFSMLAPIFRRQVMLARQEAAKAFNTAVGDDLEITVNIMDDINAAKQTAINGFANNARRLG